MEMKENEFLKLYKDQDLVEIKVGKGLCFHLSVNRETAHLIRNATVKEIMEYLKTYQNYISPDLLDQILLGIKIKYDMGVRK